MAAMTTTTRDAMLDEIRRLEADVAALRAEVTARRVKNTRDLIEFTGARVGMLRAFHAHGARRIDYADGSHGFHLTPVADRPDHQ